jgi:hypothetical protein
MLEIIAPFHYFNFEIFTNNHRWCRLLDCPSMEISMMISQVQPSSSDRTLQIYLNSFEMNKNIDAWSALKL